MKNFSIAPLTAVVSTSFRLKKRSAVEALFAILTLALVLIKPPIVIAQLAGTVPSLPPLPSGFLPPIFTPSPAAATFITAGTESAGTKDYFPVTGPGTLGAKSGISGLGSVDGTDVADMNKDGLLDFLMCDGGSGLVYLYTNSGGGSFTPAVVASGITASGFCTNLRVADFNGDGLLDFVVGDNRNGLGTKVYLQGPVGTFTISATLDTSWTGFGNNLFGVAVGDVDGDHKVDILMLGYGGAGAGQVRFYKGNGAGGFAASTLLFNVDTDFGVSSTVGLGLFDIDGDGDLDIVVGGGFGGAHFVYKNNGTGTFTKPLSAAFSTPSQTGIASFDFDADGKMDLLVGDFSSGSLYFVRNLGGTLAAPVVVGTGGVGIGVGAPSSAALGCAEHTVHGHVSTTPPGHFSHISVEGIHHGEHGHSAPACLPAGHHFVVNGHILGLTPESADGAIPSALTREPDFVAALNQDGLNAPAAPGTIVQLFGSAKGLFLDLADLRPALEFTPSASGSPLYYTEAMPEVQIGGVKAEVLFSGLAPGLKGVWQINVRIPDGVQSGKVPVTIAYDGDAVTSVDLAVE